MESIEPNAGEGGRLPADGLNPESSNESSFEVPEAPIDWAEVRRSLRSVVFLAVRAAGLIDDYDDYMQEALAYFWQVHGRYTGVQSALVQCGGYIRNLIKRGRSIDSPKRKHLHRPLNHENDDGIEELRELIFHTNPRDHASAHDALEQLRIRLGTREKVVLELCLDGESVREIARKLGLGPSTVGDIRQRVKTVAIEIGFGHEANFEVRVK